MPASSHLARRALISGVLGTGAMALSGCGIRLEEGVTLPLLPTRTPLAGEPAMLDLLANSRALAARLATTTAGYAGPLTPIITTQVDSYAQVLHGAGVPVVDLMMTPSASPTATPSVTSSRGASPTLSLAADATPQELAEGAIGLTTDLAAVPDTVKSATLAVLASRWALLRLLRGTEPIPQVPAMAGEPVSEWPTTAAGDLLAATREAVYALQIVAAQSATAQRTLALSTLAALQVNENEQSGLLATPPPAPLGYRLPFPVNSPATAKKLALHACGRLRDAYGAQLAQTPSSPAAWGAMVTWLGRAEWFTKVWGGAWTPFPGMSLP